MSRFATALRSLFFNRRGKLRAQFIRDRESVAVEFRGWTPFCACTRPETDKIKKQLARVSEDSGMTRKMKPADEEAALNKGIGRVAGYATTLRTLKLRDDRWRSLSLTYRESAEKLRVRAAAVPGKAFATDIDTHYRNALQLLKDISKLKNAGEIEKRFQQVLHQNESLERSTNQAIEVIESGPALAAEIIAIAELGVEQDVECAQVYDKLRRQQAAIGTSTKSGSYVVAHRMLESARELCLAVRHHIETRQDMARAEIDLWLDDLEIADRFGLRSFGSHLSPAEAQRWLEYRVEVQQMVLDRAERARRAYSSLNPGERNLAFRLNQLEDETNLRKFARSSMKQSEYEPPSVG